MKGLPASGMFAPGRSFTFRASPADRPAMFVQSNDLFFAAKAGGIALFDAGGRAMPGNVTNQVARSL